MRNDTYRDAVAECGVALGNGDTCGTKPRVGLPFPICTRHALQLYAAMLDQVKDLMREQGYMNQAPDAERRRIEAERLAESERAARSVVYYVLMPGGTIKIGFTIDLYQRMSNLRVDRDKVLATEPGGRPAERMRHRKFASIRIGNREDFKDTPELRAWIAKVRQENGDPWKPGINPGT